jgi:hypothetical protein
MSSTLLFGKSPQILHWRGGWNSFFPKKEKILIRLNQQHLSIKPHTLREGESQYYKKRKIDRSQI